MNTDDQIRAAIGLYTFTRVALEVRRLTGHVLAWPDDLLRPAAMGDEVTELDAAWAADQLRALLGPDAADEPAGDWLKLDEHAPANIVLDVVGGRVQQIVAQLVPTLLEEHDNE
jgi:hypothetical protein